MRKNNFVCIILAIILGIAGINVQIPEKSDTDIVKAAQVDFDIDDKGILTQYNGTETNVVIPDGVTGIDAFAFLNCSSINSITIPDSVTSIGEFAFSGCSSLKEIILPNSVKKIGDRAFNNCNSLVNITIPKSVTSIAYNLFSGCHALEKITVEKGNKKFKDTDGILFGESSSGLNLVAYPAGRKGTAYTIPKKVTSIGIGAFFDCSRLKKIIIPSGVKSIGKSAFRGCSSLTELTIPSGVKEIQYIRGSFWECDSLKNLKMSVAKGKKVYATVILDEGSDQRKPTITSTKKKVATVSKPFYKTDEIGETSAKVTIAAKSKGKTKVIFQRISKNNKKIKSVLTLAVS